jgi:hypothetical protein
LRRKIGEADRPTKHLRACKTLIVDALATPDLR